ncbi:MAG: family transcriptional regulator [Modestobacter sp.]|jgi:transcriptional regulator with XRE-family HTH domain|nr:family transcriptional regulator [Modestobacter sp.]MCW2507349.1 family transcriptional regulator [Modestobacter sp.]MCW2577392.1 family transcriptional regulator [Modestobacter sp.]MCW2617534.1 family transcriptional regulator [Modestobacter sp.]
MNEELPVSEETRLARRVGAEIRALRQKARLSTRALAELAGISQPFLSQIERGVSSPSMVTTYRLAEALGVLPGALLPTPVQELVTVVRADEGGHLPVAARENAAVGRTLLMRADTQLEVIEYVVSPGQYLEEWFTFSGDLGVYLITGALDVEVEGAGTHRLAPRDFLSHPASLRHRWLLVDDQPAHVLLTIARPEQGSAVSRRATAR